MKTYIVYDNRTDDVLAIGTARECTKILGYVSVDCFYSQICSQRNRSNPKYAKRNKHRDIYEIEENVKKC